MDCEPQSSTVQSKKMVTFRDQVEVVSREDGAFYHTIETRSIRQSEMRVKEDDDIGIENQFDVQMEILSNVGGNPLEKIQEFAFPYFQCAAPCLADVDLDADMDDSSSSVLFMSMAAAASNVENSRIKSGGVRLQVDPPEQRRVQVETRERNVFASHADQERAKGILKEKTAESDTINRRIFLIPVDSEVDELNSEAESDENSDTRCSTPADLTEVDSDVMLEIQPGGRAHEGEEILSQEKAMIVDEEVREEGEEENEELLECKQSKQHGITAIEGVADEVAKNSSNSNLKGNDSSSRTLQDETSQDLFVLSYGTTKVELPRVPVDVE